MYIGRIDTVSTVLNCNCNCGVCVAPPMEDRSRIIKQLHLRSWPTKIQLGSLRERCKLLQRGPKWNLVHFSFKICHLVATSSLIFPKLYQPEKSQPKEKTFFFSRPCRGPIFLNGPNAAASIAPALIWHCFLHLH